MAEYEEKLKEAGLTGNESKVYIALLKRGQLSANELAKHIGMDRTLAYTVLNHLIEKGFVSYVIQGKKKSFKAADPSHLLNPLKEKEEAIKDLIPLLRDIQTETPVSQDIRIYEGKEGLRTYLREMMKYKKFCFFGATGKLYDLLYEAPAIAKEITKMGWTARVILHPKYKKHEMTSVKNIEFRFADVESKATTSIFGDNLGIHIAFDKPLIIIIKNKDIAETYQNWFEFMWKIARKN